MDFLLRPFGYSVEVNSPVHQDGQHDPLGPQESELRYGELDKSHAQDTLRHFQNWP